MGPHPDRLDGPRLGKHLVHQAVLNIDAPGVSARQVTDELFMGRGSLKRVTFEDFQQRLGLRPQAGGGEFLSVLLGLSGEDDLPRYHARVWRHRLTGVFNPCRMDSRMPGTESR